MITSKDIINHIYINYDEKVINYYTFYDDNLQICSGGVAGKSTGGKIPSQLSSIKVNFVPCLSKVIIHLAAAGFFGGCLFSALRYSLVAWLFSVIALFQSITGIKALPVFHYSPDDMKHLSHTGNKCQLFAFAPV